jgi:hypothetical protein
MQSMGSFMRTGQYGEDCNDPLHTHPSGHAPAPVSGSTDGGGWGCQSSEEIRGIGRRKARSGPGQEEAPPGAGPRGRAVVGTRARGEQEDREADKERGRGIVRAGDLLTLPGSSIKKLFNPGRAIKMHSYARADRITPKEGRKDVKRPHL